MPQDKAEEQLIEDFNEFIKKWCGNYYPHLIDSDDNDGEEFRDKIRATIRTAREDLIRELLGEKRWMEFKELPPKPKTRVFDVISNCQGLSIGQVKYDTGWRHYVFEDSLIKLSDRCLFELGFFVQKLNEERKSKLSTAKERKEGEG